MSYGLIGDLIAGLPLLTYYEKKFPGSYKYWVIQKKCAFTAPLFLNHPLIDRIKITDHWNNMGEEDKRIRSSCDVATRFEDWSHSDSYWYNKVSFIEETAFVAGVDIIDLNSTLSNSEMKPKLKKWFDVGLDDPTAHTYTKIRNNDLSIFENSVGIWPFGQGAGVGRNPENSWWSSLISLLIESGVNVFHFGKKDDPILSSKRGYNNMTYLNFFDQVRACLATSVALGVDTGPMWVMGAYSHPAIHLVTNYLPNHSTNFLCLNPVNDNAETIFVKNTNFQGCNRKELIPVVEQKILAKVNK